MRAEIIRLGGPAIRPLGANSSYRLYAVQLRFWNLYRSGRGNVAAYPGTSNHGWGKAVDVATQQMAAWIRRVGPRFGWSHAEGARVGEWWHFTYVGGYVPRKPDPLRFLTAHERRIVREYRRLRAIKRPTAAQVRRRKACWRWLRDQRKRIWRAAEKSGWNRAHRRRRYALLREITKG